MFIKPIEESSFPTSIWEDKAGNQYFVLQLKVSKPNIISIFTALVTNTGNNINFNQKYSDYEYRILLKLPTRAQRFVVAVGQNFESIHNVPRD
jgi:hypothetical protein